MVTAAGVAHANRLPVLLLPGDTFTGRAPDPVLQQVEHFGDPTTSVNDAFRPVSRYFDRITRPEQLLSHAAAGRPGAHRPGRLPDRSCWRCRRTSRSRSTTSRSRCSSRAAAPGAAPAAGPRRPRRGRRRRCAPPSDRCSSSAAASATPAPRPRRSPSPRRHDVPVVETVAGRTLVPHDHPLYGGALGIIGATSANDLAAEADVVLAVGTRLQDFTTSSWTAFAADVRIVTVNAARFDAVKHSAQAVVGDARETLVELSERPRRLDRRRGLGRRGGAASGPTGTPTSTSCARASPRTGRSPTPRSSASSTTPAARTTTC